jgi:hypothetical protein
MVNVNAENWDEYLTNVYPEVKKNLEEGPECINIFLPLDAKDEKKEQEFKQRLEKDAKETIERLSKRGKLSIYGLSFTGKNGGLKTVAYLPGSATIVVPLFNPLLAIVPIAYFGIIEYCGYQFAKKENYDAIRNLKNLGNNLFVHYTKGI